MIIKIAKRAELNTKNCEHCLDTQVLKIAL